MNYRPTKEFTYHVENLRAVESALEHSRREIRSAICRENHAFVTVQTKLTAMLLGMWAEGRLNKLVHEQDFFSDNEKEDILEQNLLDRWKFSVEHGFRKHYKIKKINQNSLPHGAFAQYETLIELLDSDLRGAIELRNKLAHSQWIYPFEGSLAKSVISSSHCRTLRKLNILSLTHQKNILTHLAEAIFLLVANKSAFQRDFDQIYSNIQNEARRLRNLDFEEYKSSLVTNYKKHNQSR